MKLTGWKHYVTMIYSLFYGGQFIMLGIQLPFFSGWLALKGFSADEIGLITGLSLILRLVLGPIIALWADHQHDERRALRILAAVFAVSGLMLLGAPGKVLIALAAAMVMWAFGVLMPLTDTAVLRADSNNHLNYGQTRAIGSGIFMMTVIMGGLILTYTGVEGAALGMAGATVLAFASSLLLPAGVAGRGGATPVSWKEAPHLVLRPAFALAVLSAGLTQGAHAVYYAFSFLRWEEIGYSTFVIGCLWATGVVAEILVLTRARGLALKISPAHLLALGGAGAAVRWAVTAFEPPLWLLFCMQTFHAFTYAATFLGSLHFLNRAVPTRLINTGMTIMSTTGIGAITGIATTAAGFIWASSGAPAAYALMAVMGAGAFVIALALAKLWDGKVLF